MNKLSGASYGAPLVIWMNILCCMHNGKYVNSVQKPIAIYGLRWYTYAVGRLQNSTNVGFKTLLMDMLNYGAMAQTKFEYNTENLANAGLDDYKHYATATMKTCVDYSTKEGEGHLGTQLELENNIFMRMVVLSEAVGPNAYAVITYTDYLGEEITTTVQGTVQDGVAYTAFQWLQPLRTASKAMFPVRLASMHI